MSMSADESAVVPRSHGGEHGGEIDSDMGQDNAYPPTRKRP